MKTNKTTIISRIKNALRSRCREHLQRFSKTTIKRYDKIIIDVRKRKRTRFVNVLGDFVPGNKLPQNVCLAFA
jgi:ribosomal protein S16